MEATLPLYDEYKVELETFEGPLDLLLHLIRKEEVDIYNIPIGRITEQYMRWLEIMRKLDINVAGEFIVMASTLMLIKSRMLLPVDEKAQDDDTQEDPIDPRLDLVRQLIEYKQCKEAADGLAQRELLRGASYSRGTSAATTIEPLSPEETASTKLGDIGTLELLEAFKRVLDRAKETVSFGHLKMMRWRVPDKMKSVLDHLKSYPHTRFDTLFNEGSQKTEIIVTFIAMLELLRLRHITMTQSETFGDIYIDAIPEGTPDAHLPLPAFDEIDIY